jgi:hypothetical protein
MLDAIAQNDIIVGAYSTAEGICPMLAAHRAGGRTNLIAFAKAWDRFAFRDSRGQRARRATDRELRVLRTYLEASLLAEDAPDSDLAAARREHLELVRLRAVERERKGHQPRPGDPDRTGHQPRPGDPEGTGRQPRPGDPDRTPELVTRPGWAWTRAVRRYDDYESVLAQLASDPHVLARLERDGERAPSPTA